MPICVVATPVVCLRTPSIVRGAAQSSWRLAPEHFEPLSRIVGKVKVMQIDGLGKMKAWNTLNAAQASDTQDFARKLENALTKAPDEKEDARLKQTCRDMEAVFLAMMLKSMRATVPKSGLLGQNSQEEVLQSLLDTELTKNMAQAGGIGIGDMLYRQLRTADPETKKSQAPQ